MTTVPLPDIRVFITPPNGKRTNYSEYLIYSSDNGSAPTITQNFGRQGDTATISLYDPSYSTEKYSKKGKHEVHVNPTFYIPTYSTVEIIDRSIAQLPEAVFYNYGVLFTGYVSNPSLTIESPTSAVWTLSLVDYSGYANSSIIYGQYEGLAMQDLIVLLVKQADCGIKAATLPQGGWIAPGPILPRMVFSHESLTNALAKISKAASTTSAYGWYVDDQLNLHFYDQNQASTSYITVTDKPSKNSMLSYSEAHIAMDGSFKYEYDGQSLYNRCVVSGATTTTRPKAPKPPAYTKKGKIRAQHPGPATDQWVASGGQGSFNLSRVPDVRATEPTLIVNGSFQSVAYDDGTSAPTTQWYISESPSGVWSVNVNPGSGGTTPPAGAYVSIWYAYQTQITAQADDQLSQLAIGGPNRGIFATSVNQRTLTTATAAYQRAVREITEFGHPQERISFTTSSEWVGLWRAGQTFTLDSMYVLDSRNGFKAGLNTQFVITQCSMTVTDQGFRTWSVTAVRVV
jgi:hypothetical protein